MTNISSSIFQLGYTYSTSRFLWRNSKICKCLPKFVKRLLRNRFDRFVLQWFSSNDFVLTEDILKERLEDLKILRYQLNIYQRRYNRWCRCAWCYKNRLEGNDDNIDNHVTCLCIE